MNTDAQLITAAIAGDRDAFGELVTRHQFAVYRFLARRARRGEADDLLADVWITAFRARQSFDLDRDSALPWLFGIARNILRHHWRQLQEQPMTQPHPSDPWSAIDDRLVAAKVSEQLQAQLKELPEEQLEVLLLVSWEELSPTEAALALGIPASTAHSHLRRARIALRPRAVVLTDPEF